MDKMSQIQSMKKELFRVRTKKRELEKELKTWKSLALLLIISR